MVILSTKLLVKNGTDIKSVFKYVTEWFKDCKHYNLKDALPEDIKNNLEVSSGRCGLKIISNIEIEKRFVTALRFTSCEGYTDKVNWTTDVIVYESGGNSFFIMALDCATEYIARKPEDHHLGLLKCLAEKGIFADDADFAVRPSCRHASEIAIEDLAAVINGNSKYRLPMIYVSMIYGTRGHEVNTEKLARDLCGFAHVVEEDESDYGRELSFKTERRSPRNGFIGIYFPYIEKYKLLRITESGSGEKLERDIRQEIWKALSTKAAADNDLTWDRVVTCSEKLNTENKVFDAIGSEVQELEDKVRKLEIERDKYKSLYEGIKASREFGAGANMLIKKPDIEDFFPGEIYDLIVTALKCHLLTVEKNSRPEDLLKALLESNPIIGKGRELFNKLYKIFSDSPEINSSAESELKRLGFDMDRSKAGHNELIYMNLFRFLVSCSPNTKSNVARDRTNEIKKKLNIYREGANT